MLRSLVNSMTLKRAATMVVVGGALAVWLAAAATSGNHGVASPALVQVPPIEARGAEFATEVARLHERLRPDAAPRLARNLFAFASPKPSPAPAAAAPALAEAPRAQPIAPPPLKFIGVAEDPGPQGPERTAIISGLGQLFLVKTGERVTSRYRVAKIDADVVELVDEDNGATLRLALK